MIKRIFVTLICLNLAFFSPFSNAFSFGNWAQTSAKSFGSKTALGFRTTAPVTSSNPAGLLYSGVTVNANPSALAKLYKKVGPTAAFTLAVTAILGAVDWVLDPENSQVIYEEELPPTYYFYTESFSSDPTCVDVEVSIAQMYDHSIRCIKSTSSTYKQNYNNSDFYLEPLETEPKKLSSSDTAPRRTEVLVKRTQSNPDYFPGGENIVRNYVTVYYFKSLVENKTKTLSYEAIGAEVISEADSGSNVAQDDTKNAADPKNWTRPNYPYGDLEPEIEANKKEAECDPLKGAKNSCYGKVGSPLKADPDGTVEVANPDGTTTKYFPDGRVERSGAPGGINDGIKTTTYPDGTKVTTYPDGTKIITKPDGTITTEEPPEPDPDVKDPDGTSVVQAPDGSITKYFPDGSKKTTQPDGTTRTTKPDGTVVIEAPNGDTVTIAPDGTKTTTKADGKKEVDKEFVLPKFCDWATPVCELVDLVKKQFEEPDLPDPEELPEEQLFEPKEVEVDFGGGCPSDVSFDVGVMGFSKNVSFSWQPICDGAVFMNPIMQGIGALAGAYIMFGRGGHG